MLKQQLLSAATPSFWLTAGLESLSQEKINVTCFGWNSVAKNLARNGLEWVNLIQMTITSTTVGKNPLAEME